MVTDRSYSANYGNKPFGRYRLLEEVGSGGMAVISRAVVDEPRGSTRVVAIKRILPDLARYQNFVEMLATEAHIAAMLHHPGIVQVYELGTVDDEHYLAMELVDGWNLQTLFRACAAGRRPPLAVVCHIVAEVASALAYAHARTDDQGRPLALVHCDVSPSNIMVTPLGAVKLIDFGIAQATAPDQRKARAGELRGKFGYLAPEQVLGGALDRRSDIFALGVVFYELLTLERLFHGGTPSHIMRQVATADVAPPSALVPGISAELDRLVLKMLARSPEERFASCDEVLAELAPLARHLGGDAMALRQFLAELGPLDAAETLATPQLTQSMTGYGTPLCRPMAALEASL
jgi:serine/threonine-protein kinase